MMKQDEAGRAPSDQFAIVYLASSPCDPETSGSDLAAALDSAFPVRFPGSVELTVVQGPQRDVEEQDAGMRIRMLAGADLVLAPTRESLANLTALGEAGPEHRFVINEFSSLLESLAAREHNLSLPPLDRDGVAIFCARIVRAAELMMSRRPAGVDFGDGAHRGTANSDTARVSRLADALRRLAVSGMSRGSRDPRMSVPSRLRDLSGTH